MSIEKEFVPYQESLELKELGFDEPCFGYYVKNQPKLNIGFIENDRIYNENSNGNSLVGYGKSLIYAPTFQQAFRWFRERHDLCSHVRMFDGEFTFEINEVEFVLQSKETHEEAELACLKKLIQIVKEKL